MTFKEFKNMIRSDNIELHVHSTMPVKVNACTEAVDYKTVNFKLHDISDEYDDYEVLSFKAYRSIAIIGILKADLNDSKTREELVRVSESLDEAKLRKMSKERNDKIEAARDSWKEFVERKSKEGK